MSWFYTENGQQAGPVSQHDLLIQLAELPHDTLVWKQGMAEWLPAYQIAELQAEKSESQVLVPSPRMAQIKPVNFTVYASLSAVSLFCFFAAILIFSQSLMQVLINEFGSVEAINKLQPNQIQSFLQSYIQGPPENISVLFGTHLIVTFLISGLLALASIILRFIYLHRAWRALPNRTNTHSPNKVISLLLIPLFNLCWQFVAYWHWARLWNHQIKPSELTNKAPTAQPTLFLVSHICLLLGFIFYPFFVFAIVLHIGGMKSLCAAVNYTAQQSKP